MSTEWHLMNTFGDGNEKRLELDIVTPTSYFIMIMELNFAKRQEQAITISFEMSDWTSLYIT